jgi:23S rRNA pseudouridine1911/1915/1917 synthase
MKTLSLSVNRETGKTVLLDFLADKLNLSRRKAKGLIDSRNVFVNRKRVWMAHHILKPGDKVECVREERIVHREPGVEMLYEDDDYLVINKRSGTLSNGPDSAESMLRATYPGITAAHRLDRDTSGCLLLARNPNAMEKIVRLFSGHHVKKLYHVVVMGRFEPQERTVSLPIEGEPAVTLFRVFDSNNEASHLQAKIETGKTHQIRRHLVAAHFPVLGDKFYGTRIPAGDKALTLGRQMLHASVIEFVSPVTNRRIRASAPLPRDFRRCLQMYNLT